MKNSLLLLLKEQNFSKLSTCLRKWLKEVLSWLYPNDIYCICCGDFIMKGKAYSLCQRCTEKIHWIRDNRCRICGKEIQEGCLLCHDCSEVDRQFDLGITCVQYGRMEKKMIHRFKYKDCGYMAHFLGLIMAERLEAEPGVRAAVDFVAAVPMYRKKEQIRGYNQAELLAAAIARELELPYYAHCLHRSRNTVPMNRLGLEERRENVKGAFSVKLESCQDIKNRVALLIDDVYTTGSTADACAEALKGAGASQVILLTLAAGADRERKISS